MFGEPLWGLCDLCLLASNAWELVRPIRRLGMKGRFMPAQTTTTWAKAGRTLWELPSSMKVLAITPPLWKPQCQRFGEIYIYHPHTCQSWPRKILFRKKSQSRVGKLNHAILKLLTPKLTEPLPLLTSLFSTPSSCYRSLWIPVVFTTRLAGVLGRSTMNLDSFLGPGGHTSLGHLAAAGQAGHLAGG